MLNGIDINPVKKQPDCIKNQKGKPCADAKRNVDEIIAYKDKYQT